MSDVTLEATKTPAGAARFRNLAAIVLVFSAGWAIGCGQVGPAGESADAGGHGHDHGPHGDGPAGFPDAVRHLAEDIGTRETLDPATAEHVIETAGRLSVLAADSDLSQTEWQPIDKLADELFAELQKASPDLDAVRRSIGELARSAEAYAGRFATQAAHDHAHPHGEDRGHGHDHGGTGAGWHEHGHEHGAGAGPLAAREAGSAESGSAE